jgi:SAM-dependent methyltransferase
LIRDAVKRLLPKRVYPRVRRVVHQAQGVTARPRVAGVHLGDLRRTLPISNSFGLDRGQPIDRVYVEDFLRRHGEAAGVIRGRVLEVQDDLYATQFGDRASIERIDVLDVNPRNRNATVIADLGDAPDLPSDAFDCVICTQTLNLIYDVQAAVRTLHRILKPRGTALVTVPGISQIVRPPHSGGTSGDYWRFTTMSAKRLFEATFHTADIIVEAYGNVLTSGAFLYGLAAEDLKPSELSARDPDYQLLVAVKATKARQASSRPQAG